ncbi:hypothetical protein [Candidatus Caldatribacterium saccharofermentans]
MEGDRVLQSFATPKGIPQMRRE